MESDLLFARKFDQSRWVFRYDIDLALRKVDTAFRGYGGPHGYLISVEGALNVPVEAWSETFHQYTSLLWSQLEVQMYPDR